MNRAYAAELMDYLCSASLNFTPQPFDETRMNVWFDHLRDIPAEVGHDAAKKLVAIDKDFPSFARFREVAALVKREFAPVVAIGGEHLHRCRCADTGMVLVDPGEDTYRPCDHCNPEGFEKWAKGACLPKFPGAAKGERTPPAGGPQNVGTLRAELAKIGRQAMTPALAREFGGQK